MERRIVFHRFVENRVEFVFEVGDAALRGWASEHNLAVAVFDGECLWDFLVDYDVHPRRRQRGWVCEDSDPPNLRVFDDREDLWRDHLFEPLLGWVNQRLAPATALALYGSTNEASWARLMAGAEPADGAAKVVQLIPSRADMR